MEQRGLYIRKVISLKKDKLFLFGKIEILFEGLEKPLDFEFRIYPQYPLKSYGSESIKFINKNLLEYDHVMADGSICIHTLHNTNISKKLLIDFNSLKIWIKKYYINNNEDKKYEHIIVNESLIHDKYYSYIFTDLDYKFKRGKFGKVDISRLSIGIYKDKKIENYIVKKFIASDNKFVECKWSNGYKLLDIGISIGFYFFIEEPPAKYNRFIFKNWKELEGLLSTRFLNLLHDFDKQNIKKHKGEVFPVFLGYNIIDDGIHWQVALIEIGNFPIEEDYDKKDVIYVPIKRLTDQDIKWAITRNSSYKYFFGRGALNTKITNAKILIIGIGAIGSMIAKLLVKGGCRFINIADYDIKNPENVCRSEYLFQTGITDKVYELQQILLENSPFVEINFKKEYFEEVIKISSADVKTKEYFASTLNNYDIVFDCTTDNYLMYFLNLLELNCDLINLSITNHAKDLVCAFYPNIYHFVNTQFESLLDNDLDDLYEPVGCWSPTFKASYVDISLLVQMAMKQLALIYDKNKVRNNFIIKTEEDNVLSVRIEEY